MKIYPSNMNHLRYTKPTAQEIQEQYYFPCSITVLNLTTKIAEVFYYDGDGAECALGKTEISSDYLIKKSLSKTDAAPTVIGLYPLKETGTYANLGNINAEAGKLNFASFDGSAWSLVGIELDGKINDLDLVINGITNNTNIGENVSVTYNSELSQNYTYYLKSCVITSERKLNNISVKIKTAGTIDLVLLSLTNVVLHTEEKTAVVGINNFSFTDISSIPKPYYVAIKPKTSKLFTNFPADGNSSEGVWISSTNVVAALGYKIPYNITFSVNSDSLVGKFNTIGILEKSDTTSLQNAINNGNVTLLDKTYEIDSTINVPSGRTITGVFGKSILKAKSTFVGDILKSENTENIKLQNIVIEGNKTNYAYSMNGIDDGTNIIANLAEAIAGTYRTSENGIILNSVESVVLDSLIIRNLGGIGIKANRVGRDYIKGMKASKIFIKDCHTGLLGENEHEYSNYSELMVSLCQIGQIFNSGNLMTTNSIFTRCRFGIIVNEGYNHAHGINGLMELKHHKLAGIAFNNLTNGHFCPSINLDYAKILINNSKGVSINANIGSNVTIESLLNPGGSNVINITSLNATTKLISGSNTTINETILG